jgi:pilus assembly protein Flp/PilA
LAADISGRETAVLFHQILLSAMRDREGVTAIEYGLIAALIAVAAVVVISTVGTDLSATFSDIANDL